LPDVHLDDNVDKKEDMTMVADKEDLKQARLDDFNWFIDNYQSLFDQYGHKVLGIKNKNIIGVFDSEIEAADALAETEENGTYIIQECTGDERIH
jgi:hypothetical protein